MRSLAILYLSALLLFSGPTVLAQNFDPRWTSYVDDQGTRVDFPRAVFVAQAERQDEHNGKAYATSDGRARVHIFTLKNQRHETPAGILHRQGSRSQRARLAYDRVTPRFFAISAKSKGAILYRRCNFPDGEAIHCIDIRYPAVEKRAWDEIVTRMSLSLRPR
jgi:hypothetical protein